MARYIYNHDKDPVQADVTWRLGPQGTREVGPIDMYLGSPRMCFATLSLSQDSSLDVDAQVGCCKPPRRSREAPGSVALRRAQTCSTRDHHRHTKIRGTAPLVR